jgi:FkbM family methyltransferase
MILSAIRLRIKEWKYFINGKITFFQALASMPPAFMRSKKRTEVRLFGKPYVLPLVNVGFLVDFIDEIVDKNQYHVELIKDDATVVDAGANLGVFSIFTAISHPNATIYAFEPTPATFEILKENVKYYPNIKVFNYALGDREEMTSIVVVGYGGGVENYIGEGGIPVPMKTIDGLDARVDFIKIDTEGYEANIIKGAMETIRKWKPIIAMSAYHKLDDKAELPKLLNGIASYDCELHHDAEEDFICKPRIKRKLPFVSVVVVTFNRSNRITPCMKSLTRQSYPKDRCEVIVVDDGSTDNTAQIVRAQGVRVIRHEANQGISAARNTGLAAAKGEIVAYIDDDAVADPHWLEYLVQPFDSSEVTASGGKVFAYKTEYIAERYLSAVGSGNPAPFEFGKSKNPLWRFSIYLKDMFLPISIATKKTEVQAVFGCNCAYRTSALRAVGGFDETLLADEDTEISTRLRNGGAHIIFTPDAIVHHRHRDDVVKLIRQTYRRSEYTVYYYAKEKKILPIFPLPLLYILTAAYLFIIQPIIGALFIVLGPLVLYSWWPIRAFRYHSLEYLTYGYIQLALELATILGLVRGKFRSMKTFY